MNHVRIRHHLYLSLSPSLPLPRRTVCILRTKQFWKLYVNQQMLGISEALPGIFQVRPRIQTDFFVMSCKSLYIFFFRCRQSPKKDRLKIIRRQIGKNICCAVFYWVATESIDIYNDDTDRLW